MAPRTSPTFAKRQKERARQEKQQAKQERRLERKQQKPEGPEISRSSEWDVDPQNTFHTPSHDPFQNLARSEPAATNSNTPPKNSDQ
ncbi:MAG: hypothetical protein ACP5M4_04320 [Acidobacteriaceae bacterium]